VASTSHAAAVQLLTRPSAAARRSVGAGPGGTAPRSGATQGAWGRGLVLVGLGRETFLWPKFGFPNTCPNSD